MYRRGEKNMGKIVKRLWPLSLAAVIIVAGLLWWYREPPPSPGTQEEKPEKLEMWRQKFTESDLDLLARVVRAEAQGEPYDGQVAVAAVILNRVNHPEFPNTIPGVVYEPLAFSVVTNGEVNKPPDERRDSSRTLCVKRAGPFRGGTVFLQSRENQQRLDSQPRRDQENWRPHFCQLVRGLKACPRGGNAKLQLYFSQRFC